MIKKQLLIFLFILISSGSLFAQSYTEIIWEEIQESYTENAESGYSVTNYIIGSIKEEDDNTWTFYLSSDKEYLFEAFCDVDCNDLDLYLKDSEGADIDSDIEEDDYPIIYFEPSVSNRYQIKVSMYSCDVEPCYFGLAIFEK